MVIKRLFMRKTRQVFRFKWEGGLSNCAIASYIPVITSAVQVMNL